MRYVYTQKIALANNDEESIDFTRNRNRRNFLLICPISGTGIRGRSEHKYAPFWWKYEICDRSVPGQLCGHTQVYPHYVGELAVWFGRPDDGTFGDKQRKLRGHEQSLYRFRRREHEEDCLRQECGFHQL